MSAHDEKARQNDCLKRFARPGFAAAIEQNTFSKIAATLIPKFQFKAASQFDFIKNGGVLISEPGLQRSLKSYSFTWDLKRTIASTSDRVAALKAYRSYSLPLPSGDVKDPKVCVTISNGSRGYVPVADTFTAEGCRTMAQNAGAESFALACAAADSVAIGYPIGRTGMIEDRNLPGSNACRW